jgi:ATP-dependent helicase/nuclease subunit B
VNKLSYLFDIKRIKKEIEANQLILTPNNRLRSKIIDAWSGHQQSQGHKTWQTPRIYVIEQWFNQQWQQLQAQAYPAASASIINSEQQRVLWEQITANCGLMQTEAIAKQAANALNTLVHWNQPVGKHSIDTHIHEQCRQWIQDFQQQLKQLNAITPEESFRIIGCAYEEQQLPQEECIHLLGFDDISPLLETQLNKACAETHIIPPPSELPTSLQRLEFDSTDREMQAAAQWARATLEQQPTARIGIIAPNLGQCRKQIEFAFTAEFEAHSLHPNTERYTLPFNLSTGTPLGDTPLISATLNLLKLHTQPQEWSVEFLVQLLLSPFWGRYSEEYQQRNALALQLQALGVFTISGDTLRYWAQRIDERAASELPNDTHAPPALQYRLFDYLHRLHQVSTEPANKGKQLPSVWVGIFLQQLDLLYWPGERTPDSQEYQQTQLWYGLLENFANLDSVLNAITSSDALTQLQAMANQLPFQAKVPDSPIQILGILEGAGLRFTHCWIMGLHQQAWPPAPKPNALLPIRLQREHNMPHASSLRELQYAQSLTDNYRHCAAHIIFSSPSHEGDSEQHLLPSQLISDIPLATLVTQSTHHSLESWSNTLQKSRQITAINCEKAPKFTENTLIGGATFFKSQAENPFDSFAKYRLGASLPIEPMNGFSHIEKGNILHNSLAAIWQQLRTQAALLDLENQQLNALIDEQVRIAIADIQRHKPKHLNSTLCTIEQERQSTLIKQWLQFEKNRAPFTVIAIEEAQTIQFNGININIRIDRVDQLSDGRLLIIDYKTGTANINAWKGERPKEPQLPLYALCYSDDQNAIKGISFAQINVLDQCFKGLGDADICEGITSVDKSRSPLSTTTSVSTWDEALNHWQQTLRQLLEEFQQGHCPNTYLDEATKTYAQDYLRLNRFYEADAITRLMNTTGQQS